MGRSSSSAAIRHARVVSGLRTGVGPTGSPSARIAFVLDDGLGSLLGP
jgi:hypothetical protein